MTIIKAIGNTILFLLILNIISCWILFDTSLEFTTLLELESFITPFVGLLFVMIYLGLIQKPGFLSVSSASSKYYILGIILGITFIFVQTPLNLVYNELFTSDYNIQYAFQSGNLIKRNAFATILMIPVYEEFFFRKFIQRNFQKSFHPILAILFASVLFAAVHLPFHCLFFDGNAFSFHHAYITFFGALILGTLYYKSNSIGPSIVMHIFWNLGYFIF